MHRSLALLSLLCACSDYALNNDDKAEDPVDDSGIVDTDPPDTDDTDDPEPTEECNGVDDDGDGDVDEDFPDNDEDGIADCVDDDCEIETAAATDVELNEDCVDPDIIVSDPWNAGIEWQWVNLSTNASVRDSYIAPKVGNLTDTDSDGDIDADDTPSILLSTASGHLVLLSGDGGTEIWSRASMSGFGETGIADVDGDGDNDIVGFDNSSRPVLLDNDGNLVWTGVASGYAYYPMITVADLEGDGTAEVITHGAVYDGLTGTLEATLTPPTSIPYYGISVGDIDLDGQQEIVLGNRVYSPNGTLEWTSSVTGTYGHWSAIVDVDGDPEGEVLMVGGSQVYVHDHDGSVLYSTSTSAAAQPGPICVADFDGDGMVEAGWASTGVFSVYELNATQNWTATIADYSGLAGCSAYDFDGDGVYEVLFADENTFWVFDGASGTVLFSQGDHSSGTLFEYPVVADVDNDESAEILYVSNYFGTGWGTLTVLGHNSSGWPKSGNSWPIHDFAATNIEPDGTIPSGATPPWQIYNVYRARPSVDDAATDLSVDVVDICFSGCSPDSPAEIAVQVANAGGLESAEDIHVALYSLDSSGAETLIDVQILPATIASGRTSETILFNFTNADIGSGGLLIRVDDDGTLVGVQSECDESNNTTIYADWPC